jgi:hypothetical protein
LQCHCQLDPGKEGGYPDRKIRGFRGDTPVLAVTDILAHPEECKSHFSPEGWEGEGDSAAGPIFLVLLAQLT